MVPAVFLSVQEERGFSEECMVEALYVAAGIGGVIANRAFLAGAARRLSSGDRFGFRDGGRWCDVSSGRRCR